MKKRFGRIDNKFVLGFLGLMLIGLVWAASPIGVSMLKNISPLNNSNVYGYTHTLINFTFNHTTTDNYQMMIFAGNNTGDLDLANGLVYLSNTTIANGTYVSYNLTALPTRNDEEGLMVLYHFDNRSEYGENSTKFYNFGSLDNNGTCTNCPVFNVTGGKFAGGMMFDGTDSIGGGNIGFFNETNYSASVWIKLNSYDGTNAFILGKGAGNAAIEFAFIWGTTLCPSGYGFIRTLGAYGSPNCADANFSELLTLGKWHLLTGTFNSVNNNLSLYVDGAIYSSNTSEVAPYAATGNLNYFFVGGLAGYPTINGTMDEVALYNRTLSATEIKNKYQLGQGKYYWKVNATNISNSALSSEYEFIVSNLSSKKYTYQIASQLTSGIEINDTLWDPVSYLANNNETIGNDLNTTYDAVFVFNISDVNKYDYYTSARLILRSVNFSMNQSIINLTISGAATDFVVNFTSDFRPSHYTKTLSQVDWIIDSWVGADSHIFSYEYSSPNIASIINEIISRPNWNETSKTIAIFVDDNNPATDEKNYVEIAFNGNNSKLELSQMTKNAIQNEEFMTAVTANSSLLSMVFTDDVDFYVEYGTSSGNYIQNTTILTNQVAYEPIEVTLDNLSANSRWFYRVRVRDNRTNRDYESLDEKNFTTRKNKGEYFVWDQITDTHLGVFLWDPSTLSDNELYVKDNVFPGFENTTRFINLDNPDFVFDTGDTAYMHPTTSLTQKGADYRYITVRNYYENITSSVYFSLGNHEGEVGWIDSDNAYLSANHDLNQFVHGFAARLKYWPNPTNETYSQGGGDYENYYAFDWGDALFINLDGYREQTIIPYAPDIWNISQEQFDWLNETLRTSDKKWKFVISHHIFGANPFRASAIYYYGDGGGNYSQTGAQSRINSLMERYNAQFYVYGHTHLFAHDWSNWSDYNRTNYVNYISTGVGSGRNNNETGFDGDDRTDYYDNPFVERGHTRYEVSPYNVTFSFINQSDGSVFYSYTLNNTEPLINLNSPLNDTTISSFVFSYNYTDNEFDTGKNCSLFIDDSKVASSFDVLSNSSNTFSVSSVSAGTHEWYVNCSDGALSNISETRSFTAVVSETTTSTTSSGGGGGGSSIVQVQNGWTNTYVLSPEQFALGLEKQLEERERIKIEIENSRGAMETHHVGVLEVKNDSVIFEIQSDPIQIELEVGEHAKVDVTNDSYYDLYVELNEILEDKINITVKNIHEEKDQAFEGLIETSGDLVEEEEVTEQNFWNWKLVLVVIFVFIVSIFVLFELIKTLLGWLKNKKIKKKHL